MSADTGLRYMAYSRCTIQKLSLSHADVDDDECKALMEV